MANGYRCADCGARFAEPEERRWVEDHGHGLREKWTALACPICGSEEIDEAGDDDAEDEAL